MCSAFDKKNSNGGGGGGEKSEYKKFLKSQTITQLVSDVSQRLGYKFPLKVQQVLDIYDMCRYDQAWNLESPSPWCAVCIP